MADRSSQTTQAPPPGAPPQRPLDPVAVRHAGRRAWHFALLALAAVLTTSLPLPWGLAAIAFTLAAGGARSRCVAFGRGSGLPAAPGEPVDAAVRLEINRYNGAVEPRLVLRHAQPARPAPIDVIAEPAFAVALADFLG